MDPRVFLRNICVLIFIGVGNSSCNDLKWGKGLGTF